MIGWKAASSFSRSLAPKWRRKEKYSWPGQPIDSRATSTKRHMSTLFVRAPKTPRPSVVVTEGKGLDCHWHSLSDLEF
jgi:hypothetical protein